MNEKALRKKFEELIFEAKEGKLFIPELVDKLIEVVAKEESIPESTEQLERRPIVMNDGVVYVATEGDLYQGNTNGKYKQVAKKGEWSLMRDGVGNIHIAYSEKNSAYP